jgi:hypothetical protein
MGATNFQNTSRGKSISQAYSRAVETARDEYGNDSYKGTISTTSGVRDLTSEFKSSKKTPQQFIDDNIDRAEKWGSALGFCVEEPQTNKNKVKTQVEHKVTKGTKKWVLKFVVTSRGEIIGAKNTKGDAVKLAREYSEKHQTRTQIHMEKQLENCTSIVAEINYKPSTNEKEGKYVFFGWAAE